MWLTRRSGSFRTQKKISTPPLASLMDDLDEEFLQGESSGLLNEEKPPETVVQETGGQYVGDMNKGQRHGQGIFYFSNQDKYTGQWENDQQHGHGIYVYAGGDRYVGNWREGHQHGFGTYYYANGKIFEGNYEHGKPSGQGTFKYKNGEKLEGEWDGQVSPAYGIYFYANGDRYGGSFRNGKKHSFGTYYTAQGAKFQAEYQDGKPHGDATCVHPDGVSYKEVWAHGERVSHTILHDRNDYHKLYDSEFKGICVACKTGHGAKRPGQQVMLPTSLKCRKCDQFLHEECYLSYYVHAGFKEVFCEYERDLTQCNICR